MEHNKRTDIRFFRTLDVDAGQLLDAAVKAYDIDLSKEKFGISYDTYKTFQEGKFELLSGEELRAVRILITRAINDSF